jgi:hypothetical protein
MRTKTKKKKTLDQAAPVVGEMQVPWKCGV